LTDLADRARLPVTVQACSRRFPTEASVPEAETAAYFTACEGLTNALKHAGASAVRLGANNLNGRPNPGSDAGGADPVVVHRHPEPAGLADRVAAHGGTLTVDSAAGVGTRLVAEFPCVS
jgi:signal transduction histidine kinase